MLFNKCFHFSGFHMTGVVQTDYNHGNSSSTDSNTIYIYGRYLSRVRIPLFSFNYFKESCPLKMLKFMIIFHASLLASIYVVTLRLI